MSDTFLNDRSKPAVDARLALSARNRDRIERLAIARKCARKLIGGRRTVTSERLDHFAEQLLALADAQIAEARAEFSAEASALARSLADEAPPERP